MLREKRSHGDRSRSEGKEDTAKYQGIIGEPDWPLREAVLGMPRDWQDSSQTAQM